MRSNSREANGVFILTIFVPIVGLIRSIANWRKPWAKNIFWLACVYLGAVFIYCPEGTILGMGSDGGRYVLELMDMYGSSITLSQILSRYMIDQRTMDLYQPLMTYFISRFTDNGHVLFAAFAIVFGFFYSRNLWYVIDRLPNQKLGWLFVIVTLYFLVCPITQINGVRMWTATHVYVYGMMPYIFEKDKSKIWWVLITPLIHFSFLYIAIFGVAWAILPYRMKTQNQFFRIAALIFFIVTLFVNTLNLDAVNGMLAEYSPESYEERIDDYVNKDVADNRASASALNNWYVAASGNFSHWSYNLLLIAMLPCLRRNFKERNDLNHLYSFVLVLGSFANIMALIPSGGRFQVLSLMFKVPLIIMVAMSVPQNDSFMQFVKIATVFLLVPFVVEIRKLFDHFSITALLGNFVTVFFWENNVPLITFIKRII